MKTYCEDFERSDSVLRIRTLACVEDGSVNHYRTSCTLAEGGPEVDPADEGLEEVGRRIIECVVMPRIESRPVRIDPAAFGMTWEQFRSHIAADPDVTPAEREALLAAM